MSGYLKLFRKITDNKMWEDKPFARGQAWLDLLLLASWKDNDFWKRGIHIQQPEGTVAVSVKGLADRWGWSRGKVDKFLKWLENEHQIEHQKNNVTTLIKIKNWDDYQNGDTKTDTKMTPKRHQNDTIEEGKEIKHIVEYLNAKAGKNYKSTTEAHRRVIKARLRDGFSVEDCLKAIDNQCRDWLGTDYEKHLCPETLFRQSKFEKYLNNNQVQKQFTDF